LDGHNLHLIKENLKEVNERRQHVNQLSEHIGVINARLEAMGNNVLLNPLIPYQLNLIGYLFILFCFPAFSWQCWTPKLWTTTPGWMP